MKRIIEHILVLSVALTTLCCCQKWYYMITPPELNDDSLEDEDAGGGTQSESVFVTVFGDGDMNGSSWENAYDVASLRTILTDRSDLSKTVIYIAQGKYLVSPVAGPGLVIKKKIKGIMGGYSSNSTGTDVSKRDISTYETIFSGDVNGDGVANAGDCAMFMVTSGEMTFDGIVFENGYIDTQVSANNSVEGSDGVSSGAAAVFGIFGEPSSTIVDVNDCIFRANVSAATHNGSYLGKSSIAGGPCALVTSGFFRARGCSFINNRAENRGGAIRMMGDDAALFLDRCYFTGNELTSGSDGWGASIQLSYGHVCSNNCTFINNIGKGGDVNGGGAFFFCNTTLFQPKNDSYGAFRCESASGAQSTFINNAFTSTNDSGKGFNYGSKGKDITSKGYNLFQRIEGTDFRTVTDVLWPAVLTGELKDGCFEWDFTQVGTHADEEYAPADEVTAAVKAFAPTLSSNAAMSELGLTFYNWVGDSGFKVDQRGRPRNPLSFQKGSYDGYIQLVQDSKLRLRLAGSGNASDFPHSAFYLLVNNQSSSFFSYKANMVKNTGSWQPEDGSRLMWDPALTPTDFLAVAPSVRLDSPASVLTVQVASDQTSGAVSNDFMVAKETINPKTDLQDGEAVLHFRHLTSHLLIKIAGCQPSDISEMTLSGVVLDGTCDLGADKPAIQVSSEDPSAIKAGASADGLECYIIPQTTASAIKLGFTVSDIVYEWTSDAAVQFEEGKNYSLNLTLSETKSGINSVIGVLSLNK